jgi:hypothetical protein
MNIVIKYLNYKLKVYFFIYIKITFLLMIFINIIRYIFK